MSKGHSIFAKNYTITFLNAGQFGNVSEFEFNKF